MRNKIKLLFIFVILSFISLSIYPQEGDNNGKWFFEQRAYPNDTLPMTSYVEAIEYQKEIVNDLGFAISAPLQWTSIGPTPYIWGGEKTGRVTCVQYYPKVPGYTEHPNWIYLTGHGGGLWRSTNGGSSFNPLTDNLECLSSGAFAFDPNNPNIIYYGTGGSVYGFQYNYAGIGVYKSTDAGLTWSGPYRQGFLKNHIRTFKIAVNPANSNHVYLACGTDPFYYPPNGDGGGGLYKSTDGGITWAIAPGTPENKACNDVVIYYDSEVLTNRIYASGMWNFGYYVSNNGGANFTKIENNGFLQGGRTHLAIPNFTSNIIYGVSVIETGSPTNYRGVYCYKSTNGGYNFIQTGIHTGSGVDLSAASSFMSVNASPHDPQKVLVGFGEFFTNAGLYLSTNGGTNFTSLYAIPGGDQNSVAFNPYSGYENEILVGDDQGLYKSTNLGISFSSLNATLSLTEGYKIAVSPDNLNYFLAVTDAGFFKRNNTSSTIWTDTDFGADGTQIIASRYNPNVFLGSKGCQCRNGDPWNSTHMRFTTNAGGTTNWNGRAISWGHWDGDQDWVAAITQYPRVDYPNTFLHLRRNRGLQNYIDINVTNDNGNSWEQNGNYAGFDPSPISTDDPYSAPVQLVFVETSPNIMYAVTKSVTYGHLGPHASEIYRSFDNGASWDKLDEIHNYLPDRVITSLATDPQPGFENILYCTLSGYASNSGGMPGHVFRSTNYGSSWIDISTEPYDSWSLPDIPVNQIIVRRLSATKKDLIIATDAGVYKVTEGGSPYQLRWIPVASGLPNAVALGLDYNNVSRKLRVSTFGRGVFEVQLEAPVYIANELDLVSSSSDLDLSEDIIVGTGSTLRIPNNINVKLPAGKKIIVESGGHIDISSGASVTFTSQSGTWGGIEFQGEASGTLKNCSFSNTNTPIVINGGISLGLNPPAIVIDDCHFTNSSIEVTNRLNVTIKHCDWSMNNSTFTDAIIGVGSSNIYIWNNEINYNTQIAGSHGIQLSQCSDATITTNTISNADYPITVSNATSYIRYNNITSSYASTAYEGIYLNGVNNGHLIGNDVSGYQNGYYFNSYSSPNVLMNNADGSNSNGNKTAVYCFGSSPRLYPSFDGINIIWDAGSNTFRNDANNSFGLYLEEDSDPGIDYGYNLIVGQTNVSGTYPFEKWSVRCNSWENDPPQFSVYSPEIEYFPTDCTPPDNNRTASPNILKGGSEKEKITGNYYEKIPPQPIIVDYGNGLIDTLIVSTTENTISADIEMLGIGNKQVYLGNFEEAISIYKNVISTYQDSAVALLALNKIFYCYSRMNADSTKYNSLRNYLNTLASNYSTDSIFVKSANELSRKCYIKQNNFPAAIDAYEEVIENSNDTAEVISAEISVIEIYILMGSSQGDEISYTGRYSSLKPSGLRDGMRKIREKMGHTDNKIVTNLIPIEYALSQNYPNPFNPSTTINYSIPNNTMVTLKVYDILGKVIMTLVNENKDAGNYSVYFDGSNLASGVYFYKIKAGDFVQSKKMVLVK